MDTNVHVNTLHIYERLKKARASESVSKEIAEIIGSLVEDQLATKNDVMQVQVDLKQTELKLQAEIQKSKSATIQWVAVLLLAQAGIITTLMKLL